MDMEKIRRRMLWVGVTLLLLYSALYIRLAVVQKDSRVQTAGSQQGSYTLRIGSAYGNIYDRNLEPLTNRDTEYLAAVIPSGEAAAALAEHVPEDFDLSGQLQAGRPFVCPVDTDQISSQDVIVFSVPVRYGQSRLAQHLMGYALEGEGVCGLESAYQQLLHQETGTNQVVYRVDGQGRLLAGCRAEVTAAEPVTAGVVTTLDRRIQQICEAAAQQISCGAVVVMDVHSGDILAMVSRPDFDPAALGDALASEDAPFVNRALNAYSVGSVFKLAIAASAISQGISPGYSYPCTGVARIYDQVFRCHRHSGHGIQNMIDATANSCNTYFISLVQQLSVEHMLETVAALGFGRETILASSLVSAPGQVQTPEQLAVPAELANFSFGQGMLTATPLQICMMTCAFAGDGSLPIARLVQGWTADGETCTELNGERRGLALSPDTARQVRQLMVAAVDGNPDSLARPSNTRAAGKTSTAQTGQYDASGEECCHAWMTGYFPLKAPEYAVTVFVENGGSGNTAAAPVFRKIAEGISENITKNG